MPPFKYIAHLDNLPEVAILGHTDADLWQAELRNAQLKPAKVDGKAQILIAAIDAKWQGMRFRECAIGLNVEQRGRGDTMGGFYMPRSFNSSRFFATVERYWFHTPYVHEAHIDVQVDLPAWIRVGPSDRPIFHARMGEDASATQRQPEDNYHENWEGPIHIPHRPKRPKKREFFFVKLAGDTVSYKFEPSNDLLQISSNAGTAFQAIDNANFTPTRWIIRRSATHARSKTFNLARLYP